jgi:hypothetical protein
MTRPPPSLPHPPIIMAKISPVFQRIVLILAAVGTFGVAAWVGYGIFEPITAPFVAPPRARVSFDAKYDVSQNPFFTELQPNVSGEIQTGPLGNANPFLKEGSGSGSSGIGGGLPVAEQIQLGGGALQGLERSVNGGILAFILGKSSETAFTAE